MAKSYYSTVFEQSADAVWNVIRDFNNYPVWVDGAGQSHIEDGKTGDAVGAVRNVLYQDMLRRQRLLALSDVERAQTYEFAGEIAAAGARISRRRSVSRRSSTAIALSSNGGPPSIASLPRARSA